MATAKNHKFRTYATIVRCRRRISAKRMYMCVMCLLIFFIRPLRMNRRHIVYMP